MRAFGVAVLLALLSAPAHAGIELTFSNMCVGWRLTQTSLGLEVRCPNTTKAALVLKDCMNATATLNVATGRVAITCGNGSKLWLQK